MCWYTCLCLCLSLCLCFFVCLNERLACKRLSLLQRRISLGISAEERRAAKPEPSFFYIPLLQSLEGNETNSTLEGNGTNSTTNGTNTVRVSSFAIHSRLHIILRLMLWKQYQQLSAKKKMGRSLQCCDVQACTCLSLDP